MFSFCVNEILLYICSFLSFQETSQNNVNAEGHSSTPTNSTPTTNSANANNTNSTATTSDGQTSNASTTNTPNATSADPSGRVSPTLGANNAAAANKKKKKGKPKLTLLCVRDDSVAECSFDTFTGNRITFQFGIKEDAPEDIAQKMVCFFVLGYLYLRILLYT